MIAKCNDLISSFTRYTSKFCELSVECVDWNDRFILKMVSVQLFLDENDDYGDCDGFIQVSDISCTVIHRSVQVQRMYDKPMWC